MERRLWDGKTLHQSQRYTVRLVDRIGGGDSFAAGTDLRSRYGQPPRRGASLCRRSRALKQTILATSPRQRAEVDGWPARCVRRCTIAASFSGQFLFCVFCFLLGVALSSTIYNLDIDLSDSDRSVYESLPLRIARHPSESEEYLVARILAYALEFTEGIEFSRGLCDPDDPAIAVRDLTGALRAWIDIGTPDAARLHKASKRRRGSLLQTRVAQLRRNLPVNESTGRKSGNPRH